MFTKIFAKFRQKIRVFCSIFSNFGIFSECFAEDERDHYKLSESFLFSPEEKHCLLTKFERKNKKKTPENTQFGMLSTALTTWSWDAVN